MATSIHGVFRGANLFLQRRNWVNWHSVTACRGAKPSLLGMRYPFLIPKVTIYAIYIIDLQSGIPIPTRIFSQIHRFICGID